VEDLIIWRKASRSAAAGDCVEVGTHALDGSAQGIRDSKRPHDGHLVVTPAMLGELLDSIKTGKLGISLAALVTTG
jgi:hypothetical protein